MSGPATSDGIELSDAELAERWRSSWTPDVVARHLADIAVPWCVAAGWALDLFRGEQTRPHGDLEIAIPSAGFDEVRRHFPRLSVDAVGSGRIWPDAGTEHLAATHQTWLRDPTTGAYLVDVFREPHDGDTWICRHDETIRIPYDRVIARTPDGIPYLVPELVLLFKAKHADRRIRPTSRRRCRCSAHTGDRRSPTSSGVRTPAIGGSPHCEVSGPSREDSARAVLRAAGRARACCPPASSTK